MEFYPDVVGRYMMKSIVNVLNLEIGAGMGCRNPRDTCVLLFYF